ncbi:MULTISPECIES: ATP-binding protein, partial [unclassified Streptomyces]|uniref:ATP-binding protein n=1 Tax=unclassified Streptomyces TaxID=2593676 RepID=UPI00226FCF91
PRRRHRTLKNPDHRTLLSTQHQSKNHPELQQHAQIEVEPAITPGTGKSHFTEGLAQAAIEKDMRVSWFTLETLAAAIGKSKVDGSTARTVARICRADLIVIDDIGLLPVGEDAAEAFYRIIDAAYERRSIAVTSNIHPSGFDTIMPKTLAGASTDRLMHHAHLVTTSGDSHRLAEALAGKGVVPLN